VPAKSAHRKKLWEEEGMYGEARSVETPTHPPRGCLAARLGSKISSQLSKLGYQFLGDIFEHFVTNHLYTLYFMGSICCYL